MAKGRQARILGLLLALALAAALSACGGSSPGSHDGHPSDGTVRPTAAGPFPLLVPARLPAGVSLAATEFTTTDNGIPAARLIGRTADGAAVFVIDEQALVHGDGSGPDLGDGGSIRGRPATIFEGPPRLISWAEGSLWLTARSDTLSLDELRTLVESMQLQ